LIIVGEVSDIDSELVVVGGGGGGGFGGSCSWGQSVFTGVGVDDGVDGSDRRLL